MGCSWLLTSQVLKLSRQMVPPHFGRGEDGSLGKGAAEKPSQGQGITTSMLKVMGKFINQNEVNTTGMVLLLYYCGRLPSEEIALYND